MAKPGGAVHLAVEVRMDTQPVIDKT
jgi:hypothetical protein